MDQNLIRKDKLQKRLPTWTKMNIGNIISPSVSGQNIYNPLVLSVIPHAYTFMGNRDKK